MPILLVKITGVLMDCPKCSCEQDAENCEQGAENTACERCGIVFAKYHAALNSTFMKEASNRKSYGEKKIGG